MMQGIDSTGQLRDIKVDSNGNLLVALPNGLEYKDINSENANVLVVGPENACKYQTISAAIAAAVADDVLQPTAGTFTFGGIPAANTVVTFTDSFGTGILDITAGVDWTLGGTAAECATAFAAAIGGTADGVAVTWTTDTVGTMSAAQLVSITDSSSKLTHAYTSYLTSVVEPHIIERSENATWNPNLPIPSNVRIRKIIEDLAYETSSAPVQLNAPAAVVWRWDDFRADSNWWTTATATFSDSELGSGADDTPANYFARRGIHITAGVIASDIGRYVTGANLAAMIYNGHEIASHSYTHTLATQPDSSAEIQREIIDSRRVIETAINSADSALKYRVNGFIMPGVWQTDYIFGTRAARNTQAARAIRDNYKWSQNYSGQGILGGGVTTEHFGRPSITAIDAMTGANVVKTLNGWTIPGNVFVFFMHKPSVTDATVKTIADGIYTAIKAGKVQSVTMSTAFNCRFAPRVSADAKLPIGSLLPFGNFDVAALGDMALSTSIELYNNATAFTADVASFAGTSIHNSLYPTSKQLDVALSVGGNTRLYEVYWWVNPIPGAIYDFCVDAKTVTAGNGGTFALYADLLNNVTGSVAAGNTIKAMTLGGTLTDVWQRFAMPIGVPIDCTRIRLHARVTTNAVSKGMSLANCELNRIA